MPSTIPHIITQHAEEAAFLWILRNNAVHSPHYSLSDLARLDARIDAHLDGLIVAGEDGWRVCCEELKWEEPGEVFAAAALAFLSDDVARMRPVLDAASTSPILTRAMASALGYLPHGKVMPRIVQLTGSKSNELRFLGLCASAIQRIDLGKVLNEAMASDHAPSRARARRAAGELTRRDLLPMLRAGLEDGDYTARFWASWSIGLLGDRGVSDILKEFVVDDFPRARTALDLALRLMELRVANQWQQALAGDEKTIRTAILAAGIVGDPVAVPWLLEKLDDPTLARIAGEAITTITGADLALLNLDVPPPENVEAGPNDNPNDENVALDEDENLPWPDPAKIRNWWASNRTRFHSGRRLLLGAPLTPDSLNLILRNGRQRHRAASAIELLIQDPKATAPLFEVRAHARAQQQLLGISRRPRNF